MEIGQSNKTMIYAANFALQLPLDRSFSLSHLFHRFGGPCRLHHSPCHPTAFVRKPSSLHGSSRSLPAFGELHMEEALELFLELSGVDTK